MPMEVAAVEVDDRLVEVGELAARDGAAHRLVNLDALDPERVEALVEGDPAAAAVALGLVEGEVGGAEQLRGGLLRAAAETEADAERDHDVVIADADRRVEGADQALGDGDGLALVADAVEEQRELVAAEAGDGVAGADAGGERAADGDQDRVADGVAEGVVDALEVVDVDGDDRDLTLDALRAGDGVLQAVHEERAVGEAGEGVVEGLVGELLLRLLALGGVAGVEDDAADVAVVEEVGGDGLDVAPVAMLVEQAELDATVGAGRGGELPEELAQAGGVLGVDERVEVGVEELGGGVAPQALDGGAGVLDGVALAEDGDRLGGVEDERAEALLVAHGLLVRGREPLDALAGEVDGARVQARAAFGPPEHDRRRDDGEADQHEAL